MDLKLAGLQQTIHTLSARNIEIVSTNQDQLVFVAKKDASGMVHLFCRSLNKMKYKIKWDLYSLSLNAIGFELIKLKNKKSNFGL